MSTCKISFEQDVRRFGAVNTYEDLRAKVGQVFPSAAAGRIVYTDEDNDQITVSTNADLKEARLYFKDATMRFSLILSGDAPAVEPAPPATPAVPVPVDPNAPKYDAEGLVIHPGILCDGCDRDVHGLRFKCTVCFDFDLCEDCESKNEHDANHALIKFRMPVGSLHSRCPAFARSNSTCTRSNSTCTRSSSTCTPAKVEQAKSVPAAAYSSLFCPNNHSLAHHRTTHHGYFCDVCRARMPKGTEMMGCRTCDFDVCVGSCSPTDMINQPLPTPAPAPTPAPTPAPALPPRAVPATVLAAPANTANPQVASPPPGSVQRYAEQLEDLADMGFNNVPTNLNLLVAYSGNIEAVVNSYLEQQRLD